MDNNIFIGTAIFFRNLFRHGNFDKIDANFDLLTDKGEMSTVNPNYNQKVIENATAIPSPLLLEENVINENQSGETGQEADSGNTANESYQYQEREYDYSHIDDETLRKIYETIHKINEFERRTRKYRNIKFAKRDKDI